MPPSAAPGSDHPAVPLLFCIPQAGMGAWVYHSWCQTLPQDRVMVLPIELPGRNSRLKEPCATDLRALAKDILTEGVEPLLRTREQCPPYAVFGHSLGAWIAFELVKEAEARHAAGAAAATTTTAASSSGSGGALCHAGEPSAAPALIPPPRMLYVAANRAPSLAGAAHDTDPTRLSGLEPDDFWRTFERRYGVNPSLVS